MDLKAAMYDMVNNGSVSKMGSSGTNLPDEFAEPEKELDVEINCGIWEKTLEKCELDDTYIRDRYDAVIHCETECASPSYNGKRNVQRELETDQLYFDCWKEHSDHYKLEYTKEFTEKVDAAKAAVRQILAVKHFENEQPDFLVEGGVGAGEDDEEESSSDLSDAALK